MRRLGRVIGQCVALTPAPNVPEENRTKALQRRLRFFVGQAATRRRSAYNPVIRRGGVPHYFII
jgi:hypothetical protein